MKKLILFSFVGLSAVFQFCSSTKKAQAEAAKVTYTAKVQPLIATNCSPCHIPPQGKVKALNTYEAAKANIDEMITRIQKNPNEKGFMPFKHPKLPDSTINAFVRWKEAGTPE